MVFHIFTVTFKNSVQLAMASPINVILAGFSVLAKLHAIRQFTFYYSLFNVLFSDHKPAAQEHFCAIAEISDPPVRKRGMLLGNLKHLKLRSKI